MIKVILNSSNYNNIGFNVTYLLDGILKVANAGVDALNHVHGSSFRVSCVSSLASPDIAGSWIWAHQTGIPFAFALNLR